MFKKFFRNRKYRKMTRVISSFILEELAELVKDAIDHFETQDQIRSLEQKEFFKFEAMAFLFWLLQNATMFPELMHTLILDEIHDQYFARLKTHGYNFKMRQAVCDDFNSRYATYNDASRGDLDLANVGAQFVSFLTNRSKVEWDIRDMAMPLYLVKKITPKREEWCEVTKEQNPLTKESS